MGRRCPRLAAERSHGSWYLRLELGTGTDGRRRRVRRGGFPTRKTALAALVRLRGPPGSPLTVAEWLQRWLENHQGAPSTVTGYADHVRRYLNPLLGHLLLAAVSVVHVGEMFQIITREHEESGRRLKAATLDRIRATFRAALNAALRAGLVEENAASLVALPPKLRPRAVVWTAARVQHWRKTGERPAVAVWTARQAAQFLDAIAAHRLYAAEAGVGGGEQRHPGGQHSDGAAGAEPVGDRDVTRQVTVLTRVVEPHTLMPVRGGRRRCPRLRGRGHSRGRSPKMGPIGIVGRPWMEMSPRSTRGQSRGPRRGSRRS